MRAEVKTGTSSTSVRQNIVLIVIFDYVLRTFLSFLFEYSYVDIDYLNISSDLFLVGW